MGKWKKISDGFLNPTEPGGKVFLGRGGGQIGLRVEEFAWGDRGGGFSGAHNTATSLWYKCYQAFGSTIHKVVWGEDEKHEAADPTRSNTSVLVAISMDVDGVGAHHSPLRTEEGSGSNRVHETISR